MQKNDLTNLRKKEIKDLQEVLNKKQVEAQEVYASMKAGLEKNLRKFRNLRREIATILTIIREKQIIESQKTK